MTMQCLQCLGFSKKSLISAMRKCRLFLRKWHPYLGCPPRGKLCPSIQVFYLCWPKHRGGKGVVQAWSWTGPLIVHIFPSVWSDKSLYLSMFNIPLAFPLQVWYQSYLTLRLWLVELLLLWTCCCFSEGNAKWSLSSLQSALIPLLAHPLLSPDWLQRCTLSSFVRESQCLNANSVPTKSDMNSGKYSYKYLRLEL